MAGLTLSLGGKLDPSYRESLQQSEKEAIASAERINAAMTRSANALQAQIALAQKEGRSYTEAANALAKLNIEREKLGMSRSAAVASGIAVDESALGRFKAQKAELASYQLWLEKNANSLSASQIAHAAENAQMEANSAALKQLIAEKRAINAENQRYQQTLQANTSGLKTSTDASKAENDILLEKSARLKQLISDRKLLKAANTELLAYQARLEQMATPFGGNLRAMNAADQSDWTRRRDAMRVAKGFAPIGEAAGAAAGSGFIAALIKKMQGSSSGAMAQLVSVVSNTMSSLASGMNPLRVLAQQGPNVMQAFVTMSAGILKALLPIAGTTAAIGGIIGGWIIYLHRVKSLVADMVGPLKEAFNVEHIARWQQKVSTLAELQKDITDEVRRTREAYESVTESMGRQLTLTKDRLAAERELFEVQKANELAATKNPFQREQIEKKYSKLMLANKKAEREAELQSMKQTAAALPDEIKKAQAEIAKLTGAGYMSEASESQKLARLKHDSSVYDEYRKQLLPGERDTRQFSSDKDKKLIADLEERQRLSKLPMKWVMSTGGQLVQAPQAPGLSAEEQQALQNAKNRQAESQRTQSAVNAFMDAGGDRARARARVDELKSKVKSDEAALAKLGKELTPQQLAALKNATPEQLAQMANGGDIAAKQVLNYQQDKASVRTEEERLKRIESGPRAGGRDVTARERVGLGAPQVALLDVNKKQLSVQQQMLATLRRMQSGNGEPQGF